MDKFFKISERGSSVRAEIVGGVTTFFAMAYIIFVNPSLLSQTGMNSNGVMLATCISAAIGCLLTALLANAPFAQAPGMGLNAFFTFTVCFNMGYTWQEALAIVLLSGILFLVISVSPLRSKIISSIPGFLKSAISAGIGLFIAFIGLLNVKLVGFGAGVPALQFLVDDGTGNMVANTAGILTIIGLLITAILMAYKVKGAIVIGIIITTIIGFPMGETHLPDAITMSVFKELGEVAFKLDIPGVMAKGILPLVTAVISFALVDCFDTVGTLIGTAKNAGMTDKNGNLPGGDRALIADAIATCCGACLGTSTVTTFVESSTGISEGARTGLSSIVVGVLFLLACLLAPVAGIIPSAATAPALIIVGVLMIKGATDVNWGDFEEACPAFLTIAMMPFAYSISDGIGFGFISYSIIKLARGKAKEVPVLVYIISVLFILKYILTSI
ncbi:MAG: NCS2 family permease [Oscillospiraceae bacterium]|jgi:AGZA family xanthine/uracil permease-like MFS transporter|nr:NCS2 family permease [Oscillospiraceae bacterium]